MATNLLSTRFPCIYCAASFNSRNSQADHLETHHNVSESFVCQQCPASYASKQEFLSHHSERHAAKSLLICNICREGFASPDMLARHKRYDHQTSRICHCGYTNPSHMGLSLHNLHEHCCGSKFATYAEMYMHMNGTDLSGGCPAKIHHQKPSHLVAEQLQRPTLTTAPQDTHELLSTAQLANTATAFRPDGTASSLNPHTTKEALLQHVFRHGPITHPYLPHLTFTAANFDPKTKYENRTPSHLNYVECPPVDVVCDDLLFSADPRWISCGNLLRLAQNNSNTQIMRKANEDRLVNVFNSSNAVERRLRGAYKWSAKQNDVHPDVVKQWLKKTRTENGVGVREERQKEIDQTLGLLDSRVQGCVEVSSSGAPGSAATLGELDSQRVQGWREASGLNAEPAAKRMKVNGNEMAVRSD
ncbi:hypothetical protein LTR27_001657 [Elasticomyces elasticus]|nr:hypothetical protein LTR27_001657 [Elasticomyces elasticus]